MESGTQPTFAAQIAAAMDWWREAGVDLDFADEPVRWLAPAEDEAPPPAYMPPPAVESPILQTAIGGEASSWPTDLAAFSTWWLTEPSLDGGAVRNRLAPRGAIGADLMVIVPQPEVADSDELLSGPEGRLLAAILTAMDVAPDRVYYAAALPRHTPMADWAALNAHGLGAVLLHHIKLVAPQQVIVFGSSVSSLLSTDPAQTAKVSQSVYHEGRTIPLLGVRELGAIGRPKWKAAFWQRWLDWTGTSRA